MSAITAPIGKFVWYEYIGNDLKAAVDFYTRVLGWTAQDSGMADFPYQIVSIGGRMLGGMMDIPRDAKAMGARPTWIGYIWVENVDAALPKLMAMGGRVFKAPADIAGVGRFAVVADPYGGTFMLFRDADGNPLHPAAAGAPGTVGWHELHADDGAKAFAFYSGFFGWNKEGELDMGPVGVYHLFNTRHGEHGGIMTRMAETPMSFWLYYFNVEAADAAAGRIKAGGGRIINGPHEAPQGQWIVQARDPQGAMFAVTAPKR
jgi:predicted enzyme related to lactoylglutathione lyase